MTFKLEINCDNAAFEDETLGEEFSEIMGNVILRYNAGELSGNVRDSNGNTCGKFTFKGKRPE